MGICKYCGGEIEFRYIDGQCTPIHVDGGGCDGAPVTSRFDRYTRDWWLIYGKPELFFEDICKLTTCPQCHLPVYFIRHNGGSLWVDSLGWPWPKYPCFDNENSVPYQLEQTSVNADLLFIGVIRSYRIYRYSSESLLDVSCLDGIRRFVLVNKKLNESWVGEVVSIDTSVQVLRSAKGGATIIDIGALTIRAITGYKRWGNRDYYLSDKLDREIYIPADLQQNGDTALSHEESDWLDASGALYQAILDGAVAPIVEHEREFINFCGHPGAIPSTLPENTWKKLIDSKERIWDSGDNYLEYKLKKEQVERRAIQGLIRDSDERETYMGDRRKYYSALTDEELLSVWRKRDELYFENDEIRLILRHLTKRGLIKHRTSL